MTSSNSNFTSFRIQIVETLFPILPNARRHDCNPSDCNTPPFPFPSPTNTSANAKLVLRLVIIDNSADYNDQNHYSHNRVRPPRFLIFLRLHDLLQSLAHFRHCLVHIIVDSVHDRSLLDHQLIKILEDLSQFLRALC